MKTKITLFLMGYKGWGCLKDIITQFGAESVSKVISAKNNAIKEDYYKSIYKLCDDNKITFQNSQNTDWKIETEYAFAIGWRWMINTDKKIIVFHDSLLPKYRGYAPAVNAMINGEQYTGVSAIIASEGFDAGDLIYQVSYGLNYPVKIETVIEGLSELYSGICIKIIQDIENNCIKATPQSGIVSYSPWLNEDDYYINWGWGANKIQRFVNAVGFPYKGAITNMDGAEIRILDVEVMLEEKVEDRERHLGKILFMDNGKPCIICGNGILKINNAVWDINNESIFPLKRFRIRFI